MMDLRLKSVTMALAVFCAVDVRAQTADEFRIAMAAIPDAVIETLDRNAEIFFWSGRAARLTDLAAASGVTQQPELISTILAMPGSFVLPAQMQAEVEPWVDQLGFSARHLDWGVTLMALPFELHLFQVDQGTDIGMSRLRLLEFGFEEVAQAPLRLRYDAPMTADSFRALRAHPLLHSSVGSVPVEAVIEDHRLIWSTDLGVLTTMASPSFTALAERPAVAAITTALDAPRFASLALVRAQLWHDPSMFGASNSAPWEMALFAELSDGTRDVTVAMFADADQATADAAALALSQAWPVALSSRIEIPFAELFEAAPEIGLSDAAPSLAMMVFEQDRSASASASAGPVLRTPYMTLLQMVYFGDASVLLP